MSDAEKGLRLYNTLTRTKEAFAPIDADNVRMYVCGPTVYDFAHIGNARPVIVFDVLYRLLRHLYGPDHVTYVRNITDVDDKINARALRDFPNLPLNQAIRLVTEKTANQFHADVKSLGCLEPTFEPRATDFVLPRSDGKADMVTLIQRLIDRGHAYEAKGEILFDTSSMADYGQLSKRNLDEQQAGARVAVDEHKMNPQDFVLWKESSADEPGWNASFMLHDGRTVAIRGRPGWHIECSAMSAAYLGEVFDIHGGGLDLIFPHHENEIAQSRCAHGTDVMAKVWMHNGFLQVEGKKMSKSEGNFVTINELLETQKFGGRKWPGEVLRLAMLMTHYREPIDFSVRRLEEAESTLRKWKRLADNARHETPVPASFLQPLLDDVATPSAFHALSELAGLATGRNSDLEGLDNPHAEVDGDPAQVERQLNAAAELKSALLFLGFEFAEAQLSEPIIMASVESRLALIAQKNWAEADRIRDELLAQGIQLKDGKDPVTGERVTTWEIRR